jgi:MSHA biogenesis protein MshQ
VADPEVHHTLVPSAGTLAAGEGGPLTLDPNGTRGTDTLLWDVPLWLEADFDGDGSLDDPTGLATFGVYRGHDRVIYWQER